MKKTTVWLISFLLLAGIALADSPEQEIHITIKDHQFSPSEVKVKANTKIKLLVSNEDKTAEEFESFSLNREKVIRPGQTGTIFLPPLKPGEYDFFGEFNPNTAKGKIVAEGTALKNPSDNRTGSNSESGHFVTDRFMLRLKRP